MNTFFQSLVGRSIDVGDRFYLQKLYTNMKKHFASDLEKAAKHTSRNILNRMKIFFEDHGFDVDTESEEEEVGECVAPEFV